MLSNVGQQYISSIDTKMYALTDMQTLAIHPVCHLQCIHNSALSPEPPTRGRATRRNYRRDQRVTLTGIDQLTWRTGWSPCCLMVLMTIWRNRMSLNVSYDRLQNICVWGLSFYCVMIAPLSHGS